MHLIKTSGEFSKLLSSNKLVLVDFFATWCGPCKVLAPKLDAMAPHYTNVNFAKVDVDELGDVAQANNIEAMPTLIMFVDGTEKSRVLGANEAAIRQMLDSNSK